MSSEALTTVLERARAQRAALTRNLALAPDSLHRVLRCTRCQRWNLDTRVYEGFLHLGDGGKRPCWSLEELVGYVRVQHRALHHIDRLDPCACGAPASALSMAAARLFHAMPGSGAELVIEALYAQEEVTALRMGRAILGGPVAFLAEPSEEALHTIFGVPLTVWAVWGRVVAAPEGAIVPLEEGHALAAFPVESVGFRAEFEEALAAEPELRGYGLSPRVTVDPGWHWLRESPHLRERPNTVLVSMLRHDVLTARIALLAAGRGVDARREGDTVWVEEGLVRWPVELPMVAEEGLRRGFSLSTMAAAAVAHALDRIETLRAFVASIEQLRPGVTFTLQGMNLLPTRDGIKGRPIDLRTAPFGVIPDPETLDRDLRFYLREAPAWSDPWRVCPCGAARSMAMHRWGRADLAELEPRVNDLVLADDPDPDAEGETVRVFALSCDRHVEYALRPLPPSSGSDPEALRARVVVDLHRQRFALKVARHTDPHGRSVALVESANLLDATTHPALVAGLVATALGASLGATVTTLSRELAVVAETGAEESLVTRLEEVGAMLWTLQRGRPPTARRAVFDSEAGAPSAGEFVQVEESPGGRASPGR